MGLAERKVKRHDPRNLAWSGDTNRFSYKHMTALGWTGDKGLGTHGDGNPNHIAVVRRTDNGGIGMARAKKEGDDNAAGAGQAGRGLEDVLKRLAAASASASPSPAPESPAEPSDKEVKKRNKIASRQKHLQSKRLASSSPAALAEILGVPVSSLPASPSPSSPATPAESTPEPSTPVENLDPEKDRTSEETVKTSTLSVTDYFKQKMKEKMLARQAAAAANGVVAPELAPGSLAAIKADDPKKAIGGVAWEGSKMAFEDVKVELGDLGAEAGPSSVQIEEITVKMEEMDEKAAKKARKEAKRLAKLAKSEPETPADDFAVKVEADVQDAAAKAKREKKERKEAKKRQAAEDNVDMVVKKEKEKKRKRDDDSGEVKLKKEKKSKEGKEKKRKEGESD